MYISGHQYRYVHEIFSHKFTTPYDVLVELYLGVKYIGEKNAEWKVTGSEYHNIDIDLVVPHKLMVDEQYVVLKYMKP